ncbi:MAG: glycosyltransferase family 4 protein [Acidobacteriaceae bacterium]|nr:glycosyltransferase family 4 protein [Acidobacteriaceae bacterium]
MKLVAARGPGQFGGIFRRFRQLCEYCEGKHELLGVMPMAASDEPLHAPVRTLSYARTHVSTGIIRAESVKAVLEACETIIGRLARDLKQESPDKVLAADTDLKGLCVIEACHRAGLQVTTFVAGLSSVEVEFDSRSGFRFMPLVEQFCLEQSDRLIFPSQFAADYCAARFPGMAPYTVIRNGIADEFLNAPPPNPEPRRIGAVMRTSGIKNPDMLAAVAERLRERGFSIDLVTGSAARSRLAQLSAVRLLPQTTCTAALASFYGGCQAILSPSHFEVSGNVPMEAVASGTPAVITHRMGVREIFDDLGMQHLVVPVGDVDGAADRLANAEPIPEAVRDHLREAYSWPTVCARIVAAV